jgi:hypothetical protein
MKKKKKEKKKPWRALNEQEKKKKTVTGFEQSNGLLSPLHFCQWW